MQGGDDADLHIWQTRADLRTGGISLIFIHTQLLHRLTATRRHRRDLQRVRVGGGDGLLLVLGGHFDGLADERQLLAGDDVVVHRAVSACGRRD